MTTPPKPHAPSLTEMRTFKCPHSYCDHAVIDHASPTEARAATGCLVANCPCTLNNFEVLHFLFNRKMAEEYEYSFSKGHAYGRASLHNELLDAIRDEGLAPYHETFLHDTYAREK